MKKSTLKVSVNHWLFVHLIDLLISNLNPSLLIKMVSKIEYEYWLLKKIIYKTKNQHGNTLLYRRLNQLKRFVGRYIKHNHILKIKELCENVFILATSNIEMKHFIGLSLVAMGICARIYFLIEKIESEIIDDIFSLV